MLVEYPCINSEFVEKKKLTNGWQLQNILSTRILHSFLYETNHRQDLTDTYSEMWIDLNIAVVG